VFRAIGAVVSRYPRRVLLFWALLIAICLPLAGRVGEVLTTDAGIAPGSQAQEIRRTLLREFAGNNNHQLLIVADADPDAPPELRERHRERFEAALAEITAQPFVENVLDSTTQGPLQLPELGAESASSAALVILNAQNKARVETITTWVRETLSTFETDGLELFVTGSVAVEQEINAISAQDTARAERFGLPLSLLVLGLAFGALVAASLPLVVAVISITLSLAALFVMGQFFTFATFAQIVVTMLGLSTGIDYALFMVNRFREELALVGDPVRATRRAVETAGKALTFSGLTVLVALAALLVPPLQFVQSIGVASMVVMLFSVLASLTALPAALTLLGPRVNAVRLTRLVPGSRSRHFWRRRAEAVTRRPLLWTLVGVTALVTLALPAFRMQVSFAGVRGLTQETDTRRAQMVLENLGLDSLLTSFDVLIDFGERGFFHPSSVRATSELSRRTSDLPLVAQVLAPTETGGFPPLLLSGYYATQETALASPLADLVRATVSLNGRYALLRAFPESGITPLQAQALETRLQNLVRQSGLEAIIGGGFVIEREWASVLYRSFPWAVALVYLVTFVLLGLAFRSVVIPLKSILTNTLTVSAAFGVITAVFQFGWGAPLIGLGGGFGFVETSVPIFIFAIVFGLSIDYEVFLVSRMVENHERGMNDRDAIVHAVSATGGVITSAALIMGVVFAAFLFSNVVLIKTLSLGLTVAVLLDATLVRLVLVPSIMLLAGRWNWWLPKGVARFARRLDLGHD
jgi:RND superfamily putative drug exporter